MNEKSKAKLRKIIREEYQIIKEGAGKLFLNYLVKNKLDYKTNEDYFKNSNAYLNFMAEITKNAFTESNFHSEANEVPKYFKVSGKPLNKLLDRHAFDLGDKLAHYAKWDIYDVIKIMDHILKSQTIKGFDAKKAIKELF